MKLSDREYYSRRLDQESAAAQAAGTTEAQWVHLELAELYLKRLQASESAAAAGMGRPPIVSLVDGETTAASRRNPRFNPKMILGAWLKGKL